LDWLKRGDHVSAPKRPITAEDVNRLITIEDPQISPDGQWVAFVQVSANPAEKGYTRNIYLAATDGSRVLQFTRSGKDSSPRWSPDGTRLAFVSGRGGKPQVYLAMTTAPGGEPRALTNALNGATAPAWSPDGAYIAYLSAMNTVELAKEASGEPDPKPQDSLEAKQRKERQEEDEKNRFDPRWVERIPFRQGTTFLDDRWQQIYVIATADGLEGAAAKPRRVSLGRVAYGAPEWSPDGQTLYTVRPKREDADEWWRENNVYALRVSDGHETRFVDDDHFVFGAPQVSPNGQWIVTERILANTSDRLARIVLYSTDGGAALDINLELDRQIAPCRWTADSDLLLVVAMEGDSHLYLYHTETSTFTPLLTGTRMIQGLSVTTTNSIALAMSTPDNPAELYFRRHEEFEPLTQVNAKFLQEVIVQPTHEIHYQLSDGTEIEGWYLLPVGYEAGKKYPLALNIHGGPHIMWGAAFQSQWHEWQFYAARGYVVFFCNPRGSDGYGDAFEKVLHGNWSGATEDVLAGVTYLVQQGIVDEQRLAVTGGSYGGYLTAWLIAHDHRFKCAVSHRGVYNLLSFFGTSDIPVFVPNEFDFMPYTEPLQLWQHSPLAHAHQIQTPLLIIHAENDYRVPIEQGEQLFTYIKRNGGTVKMLRYPREGHEMTRAGEPAHRISNLLATVEWFDAYCDLPES
jgi:dipeptidyl aminopeptidase/acylaminoacyl peptidase